ncbi:MAG: sigma-70 family RNA polymerase sigma factor [bacterium]|nr:sigma-70 family RNA polymerase sigma factor [bacterium]
MCPDDPAEMPPADRLAATNELISRAQRGHADALEEVYARYLPRLARWASGRVPTGARHLQETADLVQNVLMHFLGKVNDFQPQFDGALMAYLCTAVKNRVRDLGRQAARRPAELDIADHDVVAHTETPYEVCVSRDIRERYEAALERLTDDQRTAVVLKVELGYGPTEIAGAMGKPTPDAARVFTERAIRKLAEAMSDV